MNPPVKPGRSGLRITLAIAWKDILDSLKNKVLIGLLIGVATLMVGALGIRMLVGGSGQPRIALAGPASRELVRELRREFNLTANALNDRESLEFELGQSTAPAVGVIIDGDVTQLAGSGGTVELQALTPYWVDPALARSAFDELETRLGQLWDARVVIDSVSMVYPTLESGGQIVMIAAGLVNAIFIVGLYMTPGLIQEEKQNGTMASLLLSPAGMLHIVFGKSLAALAYCLVAAGAFCLMASSLIVHWGVLLAAILAGSIFAVMLGLVIGVYSEHAASMNLWLGLLLILLLLPVVAQTLASNLPGALAVVLSWLPGIAVGEIVRMSMTASPVLPQLALDLVRILLPTLLLFGLSVWRIQRQEV